MQMQRKCPPVLVLVLVLVSMSASGWQAPELVAGSKPDDWMKASEGVIGLQRGEVTPSELAPPASDAKAPARAESATSRPPAEGSRRERMQRRYGLTVRPHRGWQPDRSVGRSLPFHHPGIDSVDEDLVREEMLEVFTGIDVMDTYLSLLRIFNIKLYVRELVGEDAFYTLQINPEAHLAIVLTDGKKNAAAVLLMRESEEHQGVFFLDDPQLAIEEIGWGIEAFFKNSRPRLVFASLTGVLPDERPFTPAYSIRLGEIPVETGARFHHYQPHQVSERRRLNMDGWFLR